MLMVIGGKRRHEIEVISYGLDDDQCRFIDA